MLELNLKCELKGDLGERVPGRENEGAETWGRKEYANIKNGQSGCSRLMRRRV
jgi:hypothetical protein